MPYRAVIFDLDDTLLDTRALRPLREAKRWRECFASLGLAVPFETDDPVAVQELPARVRERRLGVGLLTHSPKPYADGLLQRFGIRVDAMVTGSDNYAYKPNPSGLEAVAAELGVPPAQCVYVGDTIGDFGAAAGAGMLSVGVAWDGNFPGIDWQRAWPDVAIASTARLLALVDGDDGLRPLGETLAAGAAPTVHRGSLVRLGNGIYGLGRYFNTGDRRHPGHALSLLVLRAKNDPDAAAEVAAIFDFLARRATARPPGLVVSVPPAPDQDYDRFERPRAELAKAWNARDGGGTLRMLYKVEEYKSMSPEARRAQNVGRFESDPLNGERVALIDDVLTSGGQAEACRDTLIAAGAAHVDILVLGVAQEALPELCPVCNGLLRTFRRGRDGRPFIGCTNYFTTGCPYTRDIPDARQVAP